MPHIVNGIFAAEATSEVLMARERDNRKNHTEGGWSFPGGHVEAGKQNDQPWFRWNERRNWCCAQLRFITGLICVWLPTASDAFFPYCSCVTAWARRSVYP